MGTAQLQFLYGGPLSPREAIPKAEASTRKALELDDSLAQAHRTLAEILQTFYWKWEEAEQEFRRARELRGDSADDPRAELIRQRRFEEAIADAEHAQRLDPLSFGARVAVAVVCRAAGQYDRAVAELRRALELFPDQRRGHFQLGVTFMLMGRTKDAIAELETSIESPRTRRT
jgi:tetratricopeptide (TPR) repeat protein